MVNTHLDHVSQIARENQAKVVVEDTLAYPEGYPQVLTGDMNCDASNPAIEVFTQAGWKDTYQMVHGTMDPGFTYHAFIGDDFEAKIGKIDFIFTRGAARVSDAKIVRDSEEILLPGEEPPTGKRRFPSDHYFITADIDL